MHTLCPGEQASRNVAAAARQDGGGDSDRPAAAAAAAAAEGGGGGGAAPGRRERRSGVGSRSTRAASWWPRWPTQEEREALHAATLALQEEREVYRPGRNGRSKRSLGTVLRFRSAVLEGYAPVFYFFFFVISLSLYIFLTLFLL